MIDAHQYYIGPAGWSYKDWEGIVYPPNKGKNFSKLQYISQFFTTVEINSSFYKPPSSTVTEKWVNEVKENPQFFFTYKLWQEFTHNRDTHALNQNERLAKTGLDPLLENGKLGATLIQFPWSFENSVENQLWITKLCEIFKAYFPVIEIRHESWNTPETFQYLKEKEIGFANIDQPVIGKSIGLTAEITGEVAYLRLHGRNYKNWFNENQNAADRYNYLYSQQELKEITDTLNLLIENSSKTYIIFNNHYRGQAVVNALQTMFFLKSKKVNTPPSLVMHYDELANIAKTTTTSQMSIF